MELRSQLRVVIARRRLILVGVIAATFAAFVVSNMLPKVYESRTTLLVGQSLTAANPDYNQLLVSQRLTGTYVQIATTSPILEQVANDLSLPYESDALRAHIVAAQGSDDSLITITAQDGSASGAAAIANGVARALIAASPTYQGLGADTSEFIARDLKTTQDQIDAAQAEMTSLVGLSDRTPAQDDQLQRVQDQLAGLRSSYATLLAASNAYAANRLTVVEPAVPSSEPASPRTSVNIVLGALIGFVLMLSLAFLLDYLDDTVKSSEEIERLTQLATLGTIVRMKGEAGRRRLYSLATLLHPRSVGAESFRTLRTNVEFSGVDTPLKTLLVTSSDQGEGKTTIAANLAVAFAQAGHRTILVDADLRSPDVHEAFELPNAVGLTDLLRSDTIALDEALLRTEEPNLRIMTSGRLPPNPAELLGSLRMKVVLERLKAEADVVILDSPPLRAVTDAAIVGAAVDGTLFVVEAGRTSRGAAVRGREALAKVNARVLGAILNRAPGAGRDSVYGSYHDLPDTSVGPRGGDRSASPAAQGGR